MGGITGKVSFAPSEPFAPSILEPPIDESADARDTARHVYLAPAIAIGSGRRNHAHRPWSLVMLESWFRMAIDGSAAEVPIEHAVC